jgi:RimJ/RimL family protein N-acetyltransferase
MKPLFTTQRMYFREIGLEDLEEMYLLHSHPEVQKYTGEPLVASKEEMAKAIQERIQNYPKYGYGRWAAFLQEGDQFIGWAGLAYLPEFDEIDLGYRFLPAFWGKGLATEACKAILQYGFEQLKLNRIIAIAMKENKASIRVMEKVGMQFEKYAPYDPNGEDVAWYVKTATDQQT